MGFPRENLDHIVLFPGSLDDLHRASYRSNAITYTIASVSFVRLPNKEREGFISKFDIDEIDLAFREHLHRLKFDGVIYYQTLPVFSEGTEYAQRLKYTAQGIPIVQSKPRQLQATVPG